MATNLDSIFKKKGKGKKPAVLNVQAAAAALESSVNQTSSSVSKVSLKPPVDDDEWVVRDKKKVVVNTGKTVEAYS